jgi:hypothetical protein
MSGARNFAREHYGSQLCRSLESALAQAIGEQFPRIGGSRIRQLCAQMVLEVVYRHFPTRDHIGHGQIVWSAIAKDDPPTPRRPLANSCLVPVVLNVSTVDDVHRRIEHASAEERLTSRCVRMCREAYEQGGLLSNGDLAEILAVNDSRIASALSTYEHSTSTVVPRRATLHDVGTALTHKRIICLKRWKEGKTAEQVARETCHTIEAVDRYLGMFERVRCCRKNAMDAKQTAFALGCSERLVREYLDIDELLRKDEQCTFE